MAFRKTQSPFPVYSLFSSSGVWVFEEVHLANVTANTAMVWYKTMKAQSIGAAVMSLAWLLGFGAEGTAGMWVTICPPHGHTGVPWSRLPGIVFACLLLSLLLDTPGVPTAHPPTLKLQVDRFKTCYEIFLHYLQHRAYSPCSFLKHCRWVFFTNGEAKSIIS